MDIVRYNHLNSYLKDKFGERVLKVCIDAGFTCPNRDGSCGYGGCIFCGAQGAGENIKGKLTQIIPSIKNQISTFLDSYRGERAKKFIAYFQSFSNTYDSIDNLKMRYDTALACSDKFVGLQVATRPDLITEEIADLLASYQDRYYVCVELGLQTANDIIGRQINRGYNVDDFVNACKILSNRNIDIVAHVMIGLPNETEKDLFDTICLINNCGCKGVKIHSTYVQKSTTLAQMYNDGSYQPISMEYYVDKVCKIISNLNKDVVIHRITADPPKNEIIAPDWVTHKKIVLNNINSELKRLNVLQGDAVKLFDF